MNLRKFPNPLKTFKHIRNLGVAAAKGTHKKRSDTERKNLSFCGHPRRDKPMGKRKNGTLGKQKAETLVRHSIKIQAKSPEKKKKERLESIEMGGSEDRQVRERKWRKKK